MEEIFYDPRHPYTWALLRALPACANGEPLPIPGMPPTLIDPPPGDAFAAATNSPGHRLSEAPPMFRITDTHFAATWLLDPRAPKVERRGREAARWMRSCSPSSI
ncbi:MAG: oligopeptide/dipeptide ABC transporter ATP-binding protein [Oscillospiraceae bacterium]